MFPARCKFNKWFTGRLQVGYSQVTGGLQVGYRKAPGGCTWATSGLEMVTGDTARLQVAYSWVTDRLDLGYRSVTSGLQGGYK